MIEGQFYSNSVSYSCDGQDANILDTKAYLNGSETPLNSTANLEGTNNLRITALDMAGNLSETNVRFIIDTIAPVINVTGVEEGKFYSNNVSYSCDGQDANILEVKAYLNGSETPLNSTANPEGTNNLRVTALDKGGT